MPKNFQQSRVERTMQHPGNNHSEMLHCTEQEITFTLALYFPYLFTWFILSDVHPQRHRPSFLEVVLSRPTVENWNNPCHDSLTHHLNCSSQFFSYHQIVNVSMSLNRCAFSHYHLAIKQSITNPIFSVALFSLLLRLLHDALATFSWRTCS